MNSIFDAFSMFVVDISPQKRTSSLYVYSVILLLA